ncbi:MAG: hypothetical protein PWP65_1018 [Clostridia bacterium]|nr:hypothetical protein [Clostridia bacterium]
MLGFKKVVSVSLGSSKRDYRIILPLKEQQIFLERVGCQENTDLAARLLRQLDGQVAALGLGGANFYYHLGKRRYPCPQGLRLARITKRTPVFDGSGWKQYGEPLVVSCIQEKLQLDLNNKKALVVSVLDRYWLAWSLKQAGCRVWAGDPFFGLKMPVILPFSSFCRVAVATMPLLARLPLKYLYSSPKTFLAGKYIAGYLYTGFEIIAGDWHFIRRYLPGNLRGKIVIASGTAPADREMLRACGASYLISTTPIWEGISPAANAFEAVLAAIGGQASPEKYPELAASLGWQPQILPL